MIYFQSIIMGIGNLNWLLDDEKSGVFFMGYKVADLILKGALLRDKQVLNE